MRNLQYYGGILMQRLHWLIFLTFLGAAAGLLIGRTMTPIYKADALLVVEGDSIPDQLASSTVQTDTNAKLQVIRKRVLSRDSLLDMAKRMSLYPTLRLPSGARDADAVYTALTHDIDITISSQKTSSNRDKEAIFLNISFLAGQPDQAAQVANELVTRVLKEDSDIRTKAARDTLDFFSREVDRLSDQLSKSAAAILRFKQENGTALPERLSLLRDQADRLQDEQVQLAAKVSDLEGQRDRLIRRHEVSGAKVDLDAIYPPPLRELARLRAQRAALQAVVPEEDAKLAALSAQIESATKALKVKMPAGADAFDQRLRQIEDEIFEAEAQTMATKEKVEQIHLDLSRIPANAAALDAMQRDQDNLREQYDRAIKSRAVAQTGDTIESLSKGERLTVIEQAVAPNEPVKPNRKTIAVAGLGAGFVLGLVLIMVRELLKPGLRRPEDLTAKLGITPFATLPYVYTAADKAQRRRQRLMSSGAVVVVVFFFVILLGVLYMPIDLIF
ncbi:hypothetical protein FGG78_08085 [Thioclava sp. BHET1]|nr:hypothetical protein FGG78_08085 [Thioclava sp. BHET1]